MLINFHLWIKSSSLICRAVVVVVVQEEQIRHRKAKNWRTGCEGICGWPLKTRNVVISQGLPSLSLFYNVSPLGSSGQLYRPHSGVAPKLPSRRRFHFILTSFPADCSPWSTPYPPDNNKFQIATLLTAEGNPLISLTFQHPSPIHFPAYST